MKSFPSLILFLVIGCRNSSEELDGQIGVLQDLVRDQITVQDQQAATILALEERLAAAETELETVKSELSEWQEGSIEGQLLETSQTNSERLDVLENLDIATETWVSDGYTTKDEFTTYQSQIDGELSSKQQSIDSNCAVRKQISSRTFALCSCGNATLPEVLIPTAQQGSAEQQQVGTMSMVVPGLGGSGQIRCLR